MRFSKKAAVLFFLFLIIGFGSACQMQQKGRKPAPDWSRGLPLGVFVRGDVDLVVMEDGELAYFVWLTEDEEGQSKVQYVVLDKTAVSLTDTFLDIPAAQIRHPRLVLSGGGFAHFLWSSRDADGNAWDLWYGQLDVDGNLLDEPIQLASSEDRVSGYDVVTDGTGGLFVVLGRWRR